MNREPERVHSGAAEIAEAYLRHAMRGEWAGYGELTNDTPFLVHLILRGRLRGAISADVAQEAAKLLPHPFKSRGQTQINFESYAGAHFTAHACAEQEPQLGAAVRGDWDEAYRLADNSIGDRVSVDDLRALIDPFHCLDETGGKLRADLKPEPGTLVVVAIELARRNHPIPADVVAVVKSGGGSSRWFVRGYFDLIPWLGYPFSDY